MATCLSPTLDITNINRADTNDLTTLFSLRYRLARDPDIDPSYTAVTATEDFLGVTMPTFPIAEVPPGTYVIHTYFTADGTGTGTKITITVGCDDVLS